MSEPSLRQISPSLKKWINRINASHSNVAGALVELLQRRLSNFRTITWTRTYVGYDYTACMDYLDPTVCCPKEAVKLNLTLIHSRGPEISFYNYVL